MKVALYARYSTDKQRDTSIADQFGICEERVKREGWSISARFEDRAVSGSTAERPGYQAMTAAAKEHKFEALLIEDLSRLSRDIAETEMARRRFAHWGVRLIGVSDGLDTNSEGHEFAMQIKGAFNQHTRKELNYRVRRALKAKALSGCSCGGSSYGYDHLPILHDTKKDHLGRPEVIEVHRKINHTEAATIRDIFTQYAQGQSPRQICHELNRRGIPSPRGKKWKPSAVYGNPDDYTGMLTNPLYRGQSVWNRSHWIRDPETNRRLRRLRPREEWIVVDVPETRIVSEELWNTVQARLRAQQSDAVRQGLRLKAGRKGKYVLSQEMVCDVCGSNYVLVDYYRYGCSSHINSGDAVCTNDIKVKRELVEDRLLAPIRDGLLFKKEYFDLFVRKAARLLRQKAKESGPQQAEAKRRLGQVEKELANLLSALKVGNGKVAPVVILAEIGKLEAEQRRLLEKVKQTAGDTAKVIATLPQAWERWQRLAKDFPRCVPLHRMAEVKATLRQILGGKIRLVPTAQGHLEGVVTGDFLGLLEPGARVKLKNLVAGEGFEPSTFGL